MHLLFLLSCDGSEPQTATPTTPTTPPAAASAAAPAADVAVDPAALLAAGLCREDNEILHTQTFTLPDGRALIEANCLMGAYQGVFEYAWADGSRPISDQSGQLLSASGLPDFDAATGTLSWLSKARGAGGCGDYFVYVLQGDHFQQQEHRSRSCDASVQNIPPPEEWPLVEATGHCMAGETVFFSCPTSSTKTLSLCGGSGTVQYRFGPPGSPELVFPSDSSPSTFTVKTENYARATAKIASFYNGDVNYQITDSIGSGGVDAESNNFQGVYVFEADQLIATVPCQGAPQVDWDSLMTAAPQTP